MCQFSQIYKTVMALGYCQNFVSAQYLVNKLIEFDLVCICVDVDQIYVGIVTRQFLANLQHSYGPWLFSEFCFCSISCE